MKKVNLTIPAAGHGAISGSEKTLVEIAAHHARVKGSSLAYTFLADGAAEAGSLTFALLDATARSCAGALLEVASPGDRALLVYEAGVDFVAAFCACLYAGLVAVPLPAPEASRLKAGLFRLESVAKDCDARLLLGTSRTHELLRDHRSAFSTLGNNFWIDTQQLSKKKDEKNLSPPELESLAYLQYTSGSTAVPKGVMVSHAGLVRHLACIQQALDYNERSVSVTWMPHFHDYGLIQGILLPLLNGTPTYMMSPFAFLKRPICWLDAISRYGGTHTEAANFAYRYCLRRIKPEQCGTLDLSSLRSAGNGGEPVHPQTSKEFFAAFASRGLREESLSPAYGLAEATLMVSTIPADQPAVVRRFDASALARGEVVLIQSAAPGGQEVVSCGFPLPHTDVAIVDLETSKRAGANRIGEIWVSSPGVALGYWRRQKESAEVFQACIAGETGKTYLRTGDLGFLHEGQLYITGRAKDLIIIHGLNYYPQDIEWIVQQVHPALRADNGAAFSILVDGEECLCVVQELERAAYSEAELDDILARLVEAAADSFGLLVHSAALIKRGSLLKTTSGKIQRNACRQAWLDGSLQAIRSWSARSEEPSPTRSSASAFVSGSQEPSKMTTNEMKEATSPAERSRQRADALLEWLREYAEHRINSRLIDERRCVSPSIILDFGNRGLFGLQVPESLGGLELNLASAVRVYQQLGAIDLSLATLLFLHNTNGIRPVLSFAAPALRDELIPILASGRELAAFALSEPGAGSNLGAIQARADSDGAGGWLLHGLKRWNGSAWAGVISVFARLVDDDGRLRGLTGFVLRQPQPGLRIGPEALTMGMRGIMQNSLYLEGVQVSRERLLGEPGKGMQVVEHVLSFGRVATAAVAVGATLRCAQLIRRFASRREIETGVLLQNPQVAVRISSLIHRVTLDHALLSNFAERLDAGDPLLPEIAMVLKLQSTESLNSAADLLMQLLGGRGYMENNLAPQILRDARALSIGEGANESLLAAVGRSVRLGDSLPAFLRSDKGGDSIAARVMELSASLANYAANSALGDTTAWRDARMGRLVCAAINLVTARSLARQSDIHSLTSEWARLQFEGLCKEIEQGADPALTMLSASALEERIDSFRKDIGDIEPLAPDVDSSLDPLLRRDTAPPPAPQLGHINEKRELLRKLLNDKLAEGKPGPGETK